MEMEIDAAKAIGSDGLTAEFRDSSSYRKMRADLLRLDPSVTDFEADQVIFWFIANPLVFETDEGKAMLASLDKRNPNPRFSTAPSIKEDGDDDGQIFAEPVARREDGRCKPLCFESGLYTALSGDDAIDGAATATASATTSAADAGDATTTATSAPTKDAASSDEPHIAAIDRE
jgi:hypothetical protein